MPFNDPRPKPPFESQLDEVLTILRRLDTGARDASPPGASPKKGPDPAQLVRLAKATIRAREIQRKHLPAGYCDEPALNILLDLFVADAEGRTVYVNDACIASHTPTSTALRWIAILVRDGFAVRTRDAVDARRTILAITPDGRKALAGLLDDWRTM